MPSTLAKIAGAATVAVLALLPTGAAHAEISGAFDPTLTYGSVEAIPNPVVVDTTPLRSKSLDVREAFVQHVVACGYVADVVDALTRTGAISTIDDHNLSVQVGAGGFNGRTTASIVYTVVDEGARAASHADIEVLTKSLGYVFSQGSAFLLDADDTSSYAFPANYVVLQFDGTPTIQQSAALFDTVGQIDPQLYSTTTSGYTQYGASYLSLQSAVPDQQFIDGYVEAAATFGVEYTPVVNGVPGLYSGGADFPSNNWRTHPTGDRYIGSLSQATQDALAQIRADHLQMIDLAQRVIARNAKASTAGLATAVGHISCKN
jgi:hypothetical protein